MPVIVRMVVIVFVIVTHGRPLFCVRDSALALEEPRIESVVRCLQELLNRVDLRRLLEGYFFEFVCKLGATVAEAVLNTLAFNRTNESEPDSAGDESPETGEKIQSADVSRHQSQHAANDSEHWRKMTGKLVVSSSPLQRLDRRISEDPGGTHDERPSLASAGPVGDVIAQKRVAEPVDSPGIFRLLDSGGHEGQLRARRPAEAGVQKIYQILLVANESPLPDTLQAAGMRETAGWKGRIRELPEKSVVFHLVANSMGVLRNPFCPLATLRPPETVWDSPAVEPQF